jgi:O-antigen/teichoic acid export membrane protein
MEFIKKLGFYSFGSVMTLLAGFVSFPLFTRMLSPADYGLMSLINLTSALCITFCKGGLQQALIREWDTNNDQNRVVVSTALFGSMLICSGVFILFGVAAAVASYACHSVTYLLIFLLTSGLVLTETIKSIIFNKIRAMQQALKYNCLTITAKYGQILFAIAFMYVIGSTAYSLLAGFIVASVLIVLWMLFREKKVIGVSSFEFTKFKSMLSFGFPLIFFELTNQLLTFVDRYFIGFYKGAEAVGKYSAAYNLTFYIQNLLVASVSLTIYPMIVEKLNKDGYAASKVFIQDCLLWFCLIGSAITLGFAAIGSDLFILTASSKYAEAAVIIAPVICGGFLYGIFTVAAGELFVLKSTRIMAIIMGIAAIMNIVLNMILIPYMGLLGAAYATLVPEIFLAAVGLWKLGIFTETRQILIMVYYTVPSCIMYAGLLLMNHQTTWPSIFVRIVVACIIWISSVLLLNAKVRKELFTRLGKKIRQNAGV